MRRIFLTFALCLAPLSAIAQSPVYGPGGVSAVPATIAVKAGAGTGATAICDTADGFTCTSHYGVVTLTTGTATSAADLFWITWAGAFDHKATLSFCNASTAGLSFAVVYENPANSSTTQAAFAANTAIAGTTTWKIIYQID